MLSASASSPLSIIRPTTSVGAVSLSEPFRTISEPCFCRRDPARTIDCRGLRRARHFALFAAGSGRRLWQRRSVAYGFAANRGNPTAPRSPWQNPYAERLIGSIRRECLDHFIILHARHLKRTLASYFSYYHGSRTHLGLDQPCRFPRQLSVAGRIVQISQLGGLHLCYERIAA
jgi:hypothetical protein